MGYPDALFDGRRVEIVQPDPDLGTVGSWIPLLASVNETFRCFTWRPSIYYLDLNSSDCPRILNRKLQAQVSIGWSTR